MCPFTISLVVFCYDETDLASIIVNYEINYIWYTEFRHLPYIFECQDTRFPGNQQQKEPESHAKAKNKENLKGKPSQPE